MAFQHIAGVARGEYFSTPYADGETIDVRYSGAATQPRVMPRLTIQGRLSCRLDIDTVNS